VSTTSVRFATRLHPRKFRAQKNLNLLLPGIYLPLYDTVTFIAILYAEAARRARRQDRILHTTLIAVIYRSCCC
jgi:hypothetical protein